MENPETYPPPFWRFPGMDIDTVAPATYGLTSVKADPGEVLGVGPETTTVEQGNHVSDIHKECRKIGRKWTNNCSIYSRGPVIIILTHNIAQLQLEVPHVLLIRPLNCHINLDNSRSKPGVSMFDVIGEFSHMSSLQGSNKLGIIPSPRPDTCGLKVGTCKPLAHVARAKKCVLHGKNVWPKRIWATHQQNPPAPKVLGAWSSGWHS